LKNVFLNINTPHGFIDKKAILPTDYCSLGVDRFKRDLKYFSIISQDILKSLNNLTIKYNNYLKVIPLRNIYFIEDLSRYLVIISYSNNKKNTLSYTTKANCAVQAILEGILDSQEDNEEFIDSIIKKLEKNKIALDEGVYYTSLIEENIDKIYVTNIDYLDTYEDCSALVINGYL